ncbi:trimeric intracellular cation channel type 1B.2-like [Asterias rubens]|uniref:trimeric intracellular cation channel type 1B.2-like n=1 Tax=Asterias rubens TaxID=7604 RepID=UPI001455C874|nr:trimeric intracellular cation channel type 1B.2-like [Asterias rubens]XP_033636463.1 trimeric intracellular cation channel type 1B.2-like [Asterias rubens]
MASSYYDTVVSYADLYDTIPMYPLFELSHYILMILAVRSDFRNGSKHLAQTNPLVCWFCSMLSSFAGTFMANFLLGQPILAPFSNQFNIGLATAVWYLIFYCPGDIFFTIVSSFPAQLVFIPLKEVLRMRKIAAGVAQAAIVYPSSFLVMLIIGTVKGTGSLQMRNIERLLRGSTGPSSNQLTTPSITMKAAIIISLLMVLQRYAILPIPLVLLQLCCMMVLTTVKLSMLFGMRDPFEPVEGVLRPVLFGKKPKESGAAKKAKETENKNKKE